MGTGVMKLNDQRFIHTREGQVHTRINKCKHGPPNKCFVRRGLLSCVDEKPVLEHGNSSSASKRTAASVTTPGLLPGAIGKKPGPKIEDGVHIDENRLSSLAVNMPEAEVIRTAHRPTHLRG